MTPFEACYGYKPLQLPLGTLAETVVPAATKMVKDRQEILQALKEHLVQAQIRMKEFADRHRTEREFNIGDLVYLKLQPYRQNTVELRRKLKLASKFFGPFPVIERIGAVAYRLQLPAGSRVHPVFHVSKLKKKLGEGQQAMPALPEMDEEDQVLIKPEAVLQHRIILRNGQPIPQILVRWFNLEPTDATWEDEDFISAQFPAFVFKAGQPAIPV